ncbi:MAG: HAD family hydrolase [Oscillospiraceae bacterium]|nr:HAD family hydrolase [Oscillospiraceae bacterium]
MYKYVFFDLDGTITDSAPGIINCVDYTLGKFGIHETDRASLLRFIGPPLYDSFIEYYGFSEEQSNQALVYYRERFSVTGIFENSVYDGIIPVFEELRSRGRYLALATAKPEVFTMRIMDYFGLSKYFDVMIGATLDVSRSHKIDVMRCAVRECGITDMSEVVMIGDRDQDINGANALGMDSIGVLYGYGSREELTDAGATFLAETPADILKYV